GGWRRGWYRGADWWDAAPELTGRGARGIGGRLVIVSENQLVDGGAHCRLLDHLAAANLAAHPAGPELPRLILIDHDRNVPQPPLSGSAAILAHPSWKSGSCSFALAARTEIGKAGLLSLRTDLDRRSAARTGSPATTMDRMPLS